MQLFDCCGTKVDPLSRQQQAQRALLVAAWTKVSSAPGVGPQEEKSRGERLNFRLVCGETSQENGLWHFASAADKGTCEFLGESFSLWWSVNKHKMRVSFGLGFYSQMNEFE